MWAPSVGLATIAPGRRAIGLPCSPAVLRRLSVVSSLRPCDTGARQHAGPAIPRARPACRGLAVLDLLDHPAAELAADQFHAGQVLRPGTGPAGVIRPLLVGGPGGLRRRWAGAGFRLP